MIGPGAVAEVVAEAAAFARAADAPLALVDLEDAVGRRLSINLGAYGTLVARKARFEEMVLPEDVGEALRDILELDDGQTDKVVTELRDTLERSRTL